MIRFALTVAALIGLGVLYLSYPVEVIATAVTLTGFEAAVLVSAVLDWREARLNTVGWRQAWMVAHATVFARAWRRARWAGAGLRLSWTRYLERQHDLAEQARDREYVVLDPAAPFDGRVIDGDEDRGAA